MRRNIRLNWPIDSSSHQKGGDVASTFFVGAGPTILHLHLFEHGEETGVDTWSSLIPVAGPGFLHSRADPTMLPATSKIDVSFMDNIYEAVAWRQLTILDARPPPGGLRGFREGPGDGGRGKPSCLAMLYRVVAGWIGPDKLRLKGGDTWPPGLPDSSGVLVGGVGPRDQEYPRSGDAQKGLDAG